MKKIIICIAICLTGCGSVQTINGVNVVEGKKAHSSEKIFLSCALGCFFILYAATNTQPYKP